MMNRAGKLLTVLTVAVLGVWGCAQGPANSSGQAEKVRTLEGKCAKLEEDYRVVAAARDESRKKTAALEEENKRVQKQFEATKAQLNKEQEAGKLLSAERDELRQQSESRTNERDVLQFRCERLKKGLQSLIGQDEAYLATPPQTVAPNAPVLGN